MGIASVGGTVSCVGIASVGGAVPCVGIVPVEGIATAPGGVRGISQCVVGGASGSEGT